MEMRLFSIVTVGLGVLGAGGGASAGGWPGRGALERAAWEQGTGEGERDARRGGGDRRGDEPWWDGREREDENARPYDGIPLGAKREDQGSVRLRFRAPRSGTVYVGDDDLRRQIISIRVKRDDVIEVDPREDRVRKNGVAVFDRNLERRHSHSVFFLRDRGRDDDDRGRDDWEVEEGAGGGYDGIPLSAVRVRGGANVIKYQATRDGRVWIGDDHFERQLVSREVAKGDIVEVNPVTDLVKVNDVVVYARDLGRWSEHSVFFRAEKNPGRNPPESKPPDSKPPDSRPPDSKPPTPKPERPLAEAPKPAKGDGGGATGGSGHPSQLKGATRVAKGKGVVSHVAAADGEFWVWDPAERRIVSAGVVKKGETVKADPANNTTSVPGGARNFANFVAGNEHEIYFRRS